MKERKDMSGVIFRNDRKEKESHPDRKGQCLIGGVEYWISGWVKHGERGDFLSLSFTPKDAKQEAKPKSRGHFDDMKDDRPF